MSSDSANLTERIPSLIRRDDITVWERSFLTSLEKWFEKNRNLTMKQHQTLQKIEAKYTEEAINRKLEWSANFTDEMRRTMNIMARYYRNIGYFNDLAANILENKDFIPTPKQYHAMCENKYAKNVISTANAEPRFAVGSLVSVRSTCKDRYLKRAADAAGNLVMIIEHTENYQSHAKNAKPVKVIPVGDTQIFETEERFLKKAKV
jgi:hypothetical protein